MCVRWQQIGVRAVCVAVVRAAMQQWAVCMFAAPISSGRLRVVNWLIFAMISQSVCCCVCSYGSQSSSWCWEAMMTTTVRMVHSTMEAMPTARLMKEKLRASREAISAVTMSPLAMAVRTYVREEEGRRERRKLE